jgi:hypothetical protein
MHSVALKIFLLVEVGNKKQEVTKKENMQKRHKIYGYGFVLSVSVQTPVASCCG